MREWWRGRVGYCAQPLEATSELIFEALKSRATCRVISWEEQVCCCWVFVCSSKLVFFSSVFLISKWCHQLHRCSNKKSLDIMLDSSFPFLTLSLHPWETPSWSLLSGFAFSCRHPWTTAITSWWLFQLPLLPFSLVPCNYSPSGSRGARSNAVATSCVWVFFTFKSIN